MNFERMSGSYERPQIRTETSEYEEYREPILLPGEKFEDLSTEEITERMQAWNNGTLKELLAKKEEQRRIEFEKREKEHEKRMEENRKSLLELEKKQREILEKIRRKHESEQREIRREQEIEQKVVNHEFVDAPDDKVVTIQERKTEQRIREAPSKEPIMQAPTDLPITNSNSSGTIISNATPIQERKSTQSLPSTEPLISEFDEEEVLDIPQLNQNSNNIQISKLEQFAQKVDDRQLSLKDAMQYFDLNDIEDIAKLHGINDMDLLQIAVCNNYGDLYNQIINGIDIDKTEIHHVPGHQYARANGSSTSTPSSRRRVSKKEHINIFNKFDLFRKDDLGQDTITYALNNNIDMFYSMVSKSYDSRLKDMTFQSPLLSKDWPKVDLLSFLMDSYARTGNEKIFVTVKDLVKNKDMFEKLFFGKGYTIPLLISFDMGNYPTTNGERGNWPCSKLLDLILSKCSKEERTYIWQFVIEKYFEDKEIMKQPLMNVNNLLNFMNKMMQYGIDIEKSDLELINSFDFKITDFDKCWGMDNNFMLNVNQKRKSLFNCDINRLETLTGKSPDVLKTILGENYLEQLKVMIDEDLINIVALRNAMNNKWKTEFNSRIYLFKNLGKYVGIPNEEGHTLFASLTSEEIVEIFDKFNPILSNEAVMDLADKPIFRETNGKLDPLDVLHVYDVIYDYIPTENAEKFYNQMLLKLENNRDTLFDFNGGYDDVYNEMDKLEYEMVVVDGILNRFADNNPQNSQYYGNKIQKLKEEVVEKKKEKQQKESEKKEMYITMQELAKQNKDLRTENERLRMMLAKYQNVENIQNTSFEKENDITK